MERDCVKGVEKVAQTFFFFFPVHKSAGFEIEAEFTCHFQRILNHATSVWVNAFVYIYRRPVALWHIA